MGNYLDSTYAAIDGVLLSYSGEDVSLAIPHRLANMEIRTVGDGAVMESKLLHRVVVPDGVRRIGKKSFCGCSSLTEAILPGSVDSYADDAFGSCPRLSSMTIRDLRLGEQQYLDLKASCARVNGSAFLAYTFPPIQKIRDAVSSVGVKPAALVPSGISRLFMGEDERGFASPRKSLDGFGFDSSERLATEKAEALRLMESADRYEPDEDCEEKNDQFLKTEKIPPIEKTAVFSFDDSKTKFKKGEYSVCVDVRIGYHFWQSVVPILMAGRRYHIYRRHYLTSAPDLHYVRREVTVYTGKKPVTERKEAQAVYAKYKLLSIL